MHFSPTHRVPRATAAAVALLAAAVGCGGPEPADPAPADPEIVQGTDPVTADGIVGPLCPVLPAGDEPGNPTSLRDLGHAEALTWIPIATIVESFSRASGHDEALRSATDVTLLVPSDDTIKGVYGDATIDALILERTDETARMLDAHLIDEALSLDELVDRGQVTTRAGTTITVAGTATEPTFDGDVELLCGDYSTGGGTIHVIGGILGPQPTPEPDDGDDDHHTVG